MSGHPGRVAKRHRLARRVTVTLALAAVCVTGSWLTNHGMVLFVEAESPAAAAGWSEGKPPRRARMGCVEAARLGARTRWQAALKTADPQTFLVAWSHGADDCAQPSISGPLISSCLLERYPLGRNRTRKLSNADFVLSVGEKRISGENRVRCCGTPILDKTLTSHPTKLGQGEAATQGGK